MGSKLAQRWVKENRMPLGAQKAGLFGAAGAASGGGQIGIFSCGNQASGSDVTMDYVTISSAGNATDFGDNTTTRDRACGTDNGTSGRGLTCGGWSAANSGTLTNVIDYVTITSAGNATDFGDLQSASGECGACSNGTGDRGVVLGGAENTEIDYVTISSAGNASDFGDMTATSVRRTSSTSNGTDQRGVSWGGYRDGTDKNNIDYITINSAGNAADFGDLSVGRMWPSACSNDTDDRGVAYSGNASGTGSNVIDYITITSTGNATDFGNSVINSSEGSRGGTDSGTDNIGIIGGGGSSQTDEIDTITISSTGNDTDFGNLSLARNSGLAAFANSKA